MSLTRQTTKKASNPATKFVQAKCGDEQGWFEYFVKDKDDPKKGVNKKIDFSTKGFFVLDHELASIRGWNDDEKFSIISNEIRTSDFDWAQSSTLIVSKHPKSGKKSTIAKGSYSDVKDESAKAGGKFHRCIYAMHDGELIHISLSGVAFASFMNQIEENSAQIHERYIRVREWKEGKRGITKFLIPQFEYGDPITKEEFEKASELDHQVQEYLDAYTQIQDTTETEEKKVKVEDWRKFQENGAPPIGSLSIQEIQNHKLMLEEDPMNFDLPVYDAVCQAVYEFEQLLKTGEWKERTNSIGTPLSKMSIQELKEALVKIKSVNPSHPFKLSVEAAIECKQAEQGPEEDYPMDDDDLDIPF